MLVCDGAESDPLRRSGYHTLVHPATVSGIAAVRQWLTTATLHERYVVMADDDLVFTRNNLQVHASTGKLADKPVTETDWADMLALVGQLFHAGYAMIGFADKPTAFRQGPRRHTGKPGRFYNVYAVDLWKLQKHGIRWDALSLMEDFHVHLSLLEAGERTTMITEFIQNPGSPNATGGCSIYRNATMQRHAAYELARLHPGFVQMKQRSGNWKGMGNRTDVTVQWGKAAAAGQAKARK